MTIKLPKGIFWKDENTPYLDYGSVGYITVHIFQNLYHSVHFTSMNYTSTEMNAHAHSETRTEKYVAATGVTVISWKHTKCPSIGEWTHSGTPLRWNITQQKEMNHNPHKEHGTYLRVTMLTGKIQTPKEPTHSDFIYMKVQRVETCAVTETRSVAVGDVRGWERWEGRITKEKR